MTGQPQRTVLIVDGSPEARDFYRHCLVDTSECSYRILEAGLAQEGLELWQQKQPDVVLLEYCLPDRDGLDLLRQLQASQSSVGLPVIMITGQGSEAIAVQALKAGAQDYLVKGQVSAEELHRAINAAIAAVQERTQFQQRVERELAERQRAEEHLRYTVELNPQVPWTANAQGEITEFSVRWLTLTGLTREQAMGEGWVQVPHPEDRDRMVQSWMRAIATGEPYDVEHRIKLADGSYRWMRSRAFPRRNAQGEIVRWYGTTEDIDDRKRSEEALRQSEAEFRTIANATPALVWVSLPSGENVFVNERWCEYTGRTLEEGLGFSWVTIIHPDDLASTQTHWQHCGLTGEVYEGEARYQHRDGAYRWHHFRALPQRNGAGQIEKWFGCSIDVHEAKVVEAALRQKSQEAEEGQRILDALMEFVPEGITIADAPDVKIRRVSRYGQQLTGRDAEVLEGIPVEEHAQVWEVFYPDGVTPATNEVLPLTRAVIQGEVVTNEEWVLQRPDGSQVIALCNAGPIYVGGEITGGVIVWRDITERAQLHREREQVLQREQAARAEAERANRIKDEFLAVLSHELRSPLNPILGWTQLLRAGNLDAAKTAMALATIERNAKLQTQLIDDLLDVARILRGKLTLNPAPVDLVFVIEAAIETVLTAAAAKSIQIQTVLSNPGQVCGDSVRLQQIIWNLLSNAIKFTPNHGQVEIRLEPLDNQAQVTVRDTGKGIRPEFLPHIFESFRQEDASTTRKYGGLGLGLAIVRSLVEAHGGSIWAESPGEDQGATFTVRLPLVAAIAMPNSPNSNSEERLDLTGLRVLTVDDEPDGRELLNFVLRQFGAEVLSVDTAVAALQSLSAFQPDVLISDIGMPDLDGYALIQQIRTLPATQGGRVPAIALTAYARSEDGQRALHSGYQRHLSKPLDPEKLVQAVRSLKSAQG